MQPAFELRVAAGGGGEKVLLHRGGDRPGDVLSDWSAVNFADGRHLGGRPGKERLVGRKQVFNPEGAGLHLVTVVAGDVEHGVARDPQQNRRPFVVGVEPALPHEEEIFPRPFGYVVIHVEQ